MKMISANTYGYNAWKCHDEGKTKKKDQNPYCHSICHSVIAHLWENLPFPIDTISNMKASSWNHLKCLSVLDTDFTFYTTMQYAFSFMYTNLLPPYTSWTGQGVLHSKWHQGTQKVHQAELDDYAPEVSKTALHPSRIPPARKCIREKQKEKLRFRFNIKCIDN